MSKLNHLFSAEKYSLLSNTSEMVGNCIESLSEYAVVSDVADEDDSEKNKDGKKWQKRFQY